jgi:AraC-like DNA-binding protein
MPVLLSQARDNPDVVRRTCSLDGAVVELCAFPEVRAETLLIAEPETVLMLGLSQLLPGSEGRIAGDPRRRFVRFGALALRPAGVPLEMHFGEGAFETLRIRFADRRIAPALAGAALDDALLAACLDLHAPAVEDAMLRLAAELEHPAADLPAVAEALVTLIVLDLARHLRDAARRAGRRTGGLAPRALRQALAMMDDPGDPPSVEAMAARCGLSRAHFIRCFTQSTGMSPGAAFRRRRVERAKALLVADHGRGLDAIARALGYAGAPSFSAAFRRETGRSPGAWRALMR